MEKLKAIRRIKFYEDYYTEFFDTLSVSVQTKIRYVLCLAQTEQQIPLKFFRKVIEVSGLYEIRIESEGNIYRIFCCFDEGNLIILFNGFQKKTQKTPRREIQKAKALMNEYFKRKRYGN